MAHDGCKYYFSFWAIFLPFYPTSNQKKFKLKTMKKTPADIIFLHKCTRNHVCCTVLLKLSMTDVIIVFHFWLFLLFNPTNNLKIQKALKIICHFAQQIINR